MSDEHEEGTPGGAARPKRRARRAPAAEGAGARARDEAAVEEAVEAIYGHAAQLISAGLSAEEVEDRLVEGGLDRKIAATVVDRLMDAKQRAVEEAARKNMLHGGLWCVGGLVVTAATYSAASGGGSYVIAWGAIIFGAIQFFRGLSQSSQGGPRR
ncbi:MAG: hypothetical protein IT372_14240 [Polyangiaceae bacterium]|nr:hypothetical protein [Polyangiaceae bacterium]